MKNIVYKNIEKKHYSDMKNLICEAFSFDKLIKDKENLEEFLNMYLQTCIIESSFCKVACNNEENVIGFIMGKSKNDKSKIGNYKNNIIFVKSILKLIFTNKENRKVFKEMSKINTVYKNLIKDRNHFFDGSVNLFVVGSKARGHGVGKKLFKLLSNYLVSNNAKSIYVYTDTSCNYGFYDSQGFKKLDEEEVYFESSKTKLYVFIYSYDF